MKIFNYSFLGNGKYNVLIDGENYIIFEDVILKYKLLSKKEITSNELSDYLKDNIYYEAYYKAMDYIKKRLRTEKEIKEYLIKKEYSSEIIERVVKCLKKDNYIDEDLYVCSYINDQINFKIKGPLKIKQELVYLGIDNNIIDEKISIYSKEKQINKIRKVIDKEVKLNVSKSSYMLKNKLLMSLLNKGFYKDDIIGVLENTKIDDKDIYEKEYKRLYQKYSKSFSGPELEYKVKSLLYQKGFRD